MTTIFRLLSQVWTAERLSWTEFISNALSDGWTMSRLARPELAILRAGVFERDWQWHSDS